jgi:hypothetical protein
MRGEGGADLSTNALAMFANLRNEILGFKSGPSLRPRRRVYLNGTAGGANC